VELTLNLLKLVISKLFLKVPRLGIRRIEAISGRNQKNISRIWKLICRNFTIVKIKDLAKSIEKLLEENSALKSEIESFKKEKAKGEIQNWKNAFEDKTERNY
jgi:alanyl-tRNA synthetase